MGKINDYEIAHLMNCNRKCQHLSDQGIRCKKQCKYRGCYHGENEIYYDRTSWVYVEFCEEHAKLTFDIPTKHNFPVIIIK